MSGNAAGGHLKTAAVVMERIGVTGNRPALVLKAAPADDRGVGFAQHAFRQGQAAKTLRPAGPFVTGEGIDICG